MVPSNQFRGVTRGLVIVVMIVHLLFFLLEAVFWMQPRVYNVLLGFLNNPVTLGYPVQALTLRNLFINQGFYNLFLVFAGLTGLHLVDKGKYPAGYALILFLCSAGVGAGIVLALTTKAFILAFLQAVPAAVAYLRVHPLYKSASDTNQPA
jgi:putative membrane protein